MSYSFTIQFKKNVEPLDVLKFSNDLTDYFRQKENFFRLLDVTLFSVLLKLHNFGLVSKSDITNVNNVGLVSTVIEKLLTFRLVYYYKDKLLGLVSSYDVGLKPDKVVSFDNFSILSEVSLDLWSLTKVGDRLLTRKVTKDDIKPIQKEVIFLSDELASKVYVNRRIFKEVLHLDEYMAKNAFTKSSDEAYAMMVTVPVVNGLSFLYHYFLEYIDRYLDSKKDKKGEQK